MTDETLRRADDLLSDLIESVETARAVPMSSSCVLPRERMLDLLDSLREVLPQEMDHARTIVARRDKLLQEAYEGAAASRDKAVSDADAVLADARHQAEAIIADAKRQAVDTLTDAREEHDRLVAATTVHQAAAAAATALREDAERYQQQVSEVAQRYDGETRGEADRYAHDTRGEAERYATKLTTDADNYAERTLGELSTVLHHAATVAEQGRTQLAGRRADTFAAATFAADSPAAAVFDHEALGDDWSAVSQTVTEKWDGPQRNSA